MCAYHATVYASLLVQPTVKVFNTPTSSSSVTYWELDTAEYVNIRTAQSKVKTYSYPQPGIRPIYSGN
jgi:hypothetical protein